MSSGKACGHRQGPRHRVKGWSARQSSSFARQLAAEQNADLVRACLYQCPPHQGRYPTEEERQRKRSYDQFAYNLRQVKQLQLREGRLRRTFNADGTPEFLQKGVDVLLAIDKLALKGAIQQAGLVACDSDFVPSSPRLQGRGRDDARRLLQ